MSNKLLGAIKRRVIYFPITDQYAAKRVVAHVIKDSNDSIILPFSDLPYPTTKEILSRKFGCITICEPDASRRDILQQYINENIRKKNIIVQTDDLFELSFKTHCDTAQKRCADIVKNSLDRVVKKSGPATTVKFLVPLLRSKYESAFLTNLYYQICCKFGLCATQLVNYYFLISDRQKNYLDARPSEDMRLYRSTTILYNTIFNITTLDSFDLRSCFGISVRKLQNTSAAHNSLYKSVHLVSLEPRLEIINRMDARSFVEFRFLVTQMMHKRTGLVNDFLARFFNDFDHDLTFIGIDRSTRCGDLNRDQYFNLFLYLKNRYDYSNSTFLQAVASSDDSILSL